jgi:hypothetical protein
MNNHLLEAALDYARAGFSVLPLHSPEGDGCSCGKPSCKNIGKHPRTQHGLKDASSDEAAIRGWWAKWPKANIGLRPGGKSVVLDVDPRHGGDMSLKQLENSHGPVHRPFVVRTGGGGSHLYFKHPGVPVKSRSGIAPGLDIRGDEGYVVVPPSRHHSGKKYEWPKGARLGKGELPILPKWLQEMITGPAPKKTKITVGPITEGERNTTLTSLAGTMRRQGVNEQEILEALLKENKKRCKPPLPQEEVISIGKSVSRYPPISENTIKKGSQASQLVALTSDLSFFHTPENEPYITIRLNNHFETWRLRELHFKRWLARCMYSQSGVAPSSQALNDALALLEANALFDGPTEDVFTRLTQLEDKIYLDLCDPLRQVVEITAHGWKIISDSPVKFRRARGMRPLPMPERGGSINELQPFLNLGSNSHFVLVVSWLLAALNPRGPYPVLVLQGEAGSAKSTSVRVFRDLVDPNTTPLRSEPRETRDLMIAARNSWCIAFDNISQLGRRLSDDLCRLATGGGFSTRQLYTDDEEKLFEATRPLLLNGIDGVVSRGDLLDRSLVVNLPVIPENRRKPEKEFWRDFRLVQPRILGALLDAVACALRRLESIKLSRLPRMADFAQWVVAAEPALGWSPGAFLDAYDRNRSVANTLALEASPIVQALRRVCVAHRFKGTATELLHELEKRAEPRDVMLANWPKDGWALSKQLRAVAPNLRASGLDVNFGEKTSGSGSKRIIRIKRMASGKPEAVAEGRKGPDGIWRFPFPRLPKEQKASKSSESRT